MVSLGSQLWEETSKSELEKVLVPELHTTASTAMCSSYTLPTDDCSWVLQRELAKPTKLLKQRRGPEEAPACQGPLPC